MSRFSRNYFTGGFRVDYPVKMPVASETLRCAPPHTNGVEEEPTGAVIHQVVEAFGRGSVDNRRRGSVTWALRGIRSSVVSRQLLRTLPPMGRPDGVLERR
jgi:hypothetical protein